MNDSPYPRFPESSVRADRAASSSTLSSSRRVVELVVSVLMLALVVVVVLVGLFFLALFLSTCEVGCETAISSGFGVIAGAGVLAALVALVGMTRAARRGRSFVVWPIGALGATLVGAVAGIALGLGLQG